MGSQSARYYIAPSGKGVSQEVAEDAIDFCTAHGHILDEWQEALLLAWMRVREDGKWAARTWATSTARQNGKNGALEGVELFALAVLGLQVLHTSHRLKTSRAAFRRLVTFFGEYPGDPRARSPELNALLKFMRSANGQEEISLVNGGRVVVGTRSSGAGRGETFDMLVIDEAQEYEEDEQEALEPTISAAPSGCPVIIFMGTPPKYIGERGAPFVTLRNAVVTGKSKNIAYVEHSAPGNVDEMKPAELESFVRDRENWRAANPGLGIRINEETVEGELERWGARSFARERLNMWPSPRESAVAAFTRDGWSAAAIESPSEEWPLLAIGLDMDPARTKVAIAMCVAAPWGTHVELAADAAFHEAGTEALVDWVWKRAKRRVPVVMDGFSPARSIEGHLRQRGIKACVLRADEYMQACMGFSDAISERAATHFDQEALNIAALRVVREPVGSAGQWKFKRVDLETDLSVIVATTCAWYGGIKIARPASKTGAGRKTSMGFAYA